MSIAAVIVKHPVFLTKAVNGKQITASRALSLAETPNGIIVHMIDTSDEQLIPWGNIASVHRLREVVRDEPAPTSNAGAAESAPQRVTKRSPKPKAKVKASK